MLWNDILNTESELGKSVVMAWVGSPAQSQMSIFLEYPFLRKSVVMSLKKHGRGSHVWHGFCWLVKIGAPLFRTQSISRNESICDCAGARLQSYRLKLLPNSLLWIPMALSCLTFIAQSVEQCVFSVSTCKCFVYSGRFSGSALSYQTGSQAHPLFNTLKEKQSNVTETWLRRQPVGYLQSVVELNQEQPETNPKYAM